MAFTTTTQKCSDRRTKLRRVQQLVNELININEQADRTRAQLIAAGSSDVSDVVSAILAGGGPPYVSSGTDIVCHADCNTIAAQIINLLSTGSGGIGWTYYAES